MLSETSWKPEAVLRLVLAMFICLFAGALLAMLVQRFTGTHAGITPWRAVAAAISFQGAALVFVHRFVRDHELRWTDAFGLSKQWRHAVLLGVISTLLFLPVGWGLQAGIAKLLTFCGMDLSEQQAVQALRNTTGWTDGVMLGIVVIVLAPVAEELLFRGILFPFIKQFGFPRIALWSSSLLFAAIHWNLVSFLPLLLLSVLFTKLYERTGNLLAPITAHALFNAINFILLFVAEDFVRTLPSQQ